MTSIKFKVDENLPQEICELLSEHGYHAHSVPEEGLGGRDDQEVAQVVRDEGRTLITLDNDFANIILYPPALYHGIIVLRTDSQSKQSVMNLTRSLMPHLGTLALNGCLWIVELNRIRVRQGHKE